MRKILFPLAFTFAAVAGIVFVKPRVTGRPAEPPAAVAVPEEPAPAMDSVGESLVPPIPIPDRASEREKRYEELLRAPIAVSKSTPRQQPAAITPEAKPAAQPAAASGMDHSTHMPMDHSTHAMPTEDHSSHAAETTPEKPPAVSDADTDLVPPRLLSIGFEPAKVRAGEITSLVAFVNDDLSGVQGVAGILRNPAGSLQGFSCDLGPEGNRFVSKIAIPQKAPRGTWTIQLLTLTDRANNRADLSAANGLPGSASFEVDSDSPDETGPVLRTAWLSSPAMRAGEPNTLFVDASDDAAGIAYVHGVFVSPSQSSRIGFSCRLGEQQVWQCPVITPTCLDCGTWQLESIQIQDRANNNTTFRVEHPVVRAVHVEIGSDRCDSSAPMVTAVEIDPPVITNAEDSIVVIRATVADAGVCAARSIGAQMIPPDSVGGQRATVVFEPSPEGSVFTGRMTMHKFAAKGFWSFLWMEVRDEGFNRRMIGAGEPVIASVKLKVE